MAPMYHGGGPFGRGVERLPRTRSWAFPSAATPKSPSVPDAIGDFQLAPNYSDQETSAREAGIEPPDLPQRGSLNPSDIARSEYLFA